MFKKFIDEIVPTDFPDVSDDSIDSKEICLEDIIDCDSLISWIDSKIFSGNLKEAYFGILILEKYREESDE